MAYKLMSPLVSIVLPSYNVGKYLQEAVESVINQTYTSYELLFQTLPVSTSRLPSGSSPNIV